MAHETALKINKKSFSNGINYHVGMKGLDITVTHKPGWSIKTETLVDDQGHLGVHLWHEKITN